jgi:voltage-gated potassium channel
VEDVSEATKNINYTALAAEFRARQDKLSKAAVDLIGARAETILKVDQRVLADEEDSRSRDEHRQKKGLRSFLALFKGNELVRYARWALIVLILSALLQTVVEWDTFSESAAEQAGIEEATRIETFFQAFWWAVVTFTTVGYGDVSPTTAVGKTIAIIMMLFNLGIVTVLSGTIASVLVARRLQGGIQLDPNLYQQHLVICGWNDTIREILDAIAKDKPDNPLVVLVNEADDDLVKRAIGEIAGLEITHISGDFTEEAVLREAFIEKARLCLVLPDESGLGPGETPDEQRTILATLTAKGIADELNVVAHAISHTTVPHLKRANANDVVFVEPHAPFLLANHATKPGVPELIRHLLETSDDDHRLAVVEIPEELAGNNHEVVFSWFRMSRHWALLGYAFNQAGFDLEKQMADSGSPLIRAMITEQLEEAGVKLSMDEKIAISVNPPDDFVVQAGYLAIILT